MSRKEVSDLYFNSDVVTTFFSDFPEPSKLEPEVFDLLSDMYFCLSSYDYVWIFRDLKQKFLQQGLNQYFNIENASLLAKKAIELYKDSYPDIAFKRIEMHCHFKEFLAMSEQELADYCITLLGGIGHD